jgi:uncharacterized membrane protein YoaK (UPF0700 family)
MTTQSSLPLVLSINAGFVDTAGFLALHGLFTAHVTGNFVTIGASLVTGTSGIVTKLLALPMFCIVIVLVRQLHYWLVDRQWPVVRTLLLIKLCLLVFAAICAVHFGPFERSDTLYGAITGLSLVAAMSIQNALHRVHMGTTPPSTMMTGTTTQVMLDLADWLRRPSPGERRAIGPKFIPMVQAVCAFAIGCALGACSYAAWSVWCFAIPPLIALIAFFLRDPRLD